MYNTVAASYIFPSHAKWAHFPLRDTNITHVGRADHDLGRPSRPGFSREYVWCVMYDMDDLRYAKNSAKMCVLLIYAIPKKCLYCLR